MTPLGADDKTLQWLNDVENSAPGEAQQLAVPVLIDEGYTLDEANAIIKYWRLQP
jgi:hypothetical protein